jgi:hypothetical protein
MAGCIGARRWHPVADPCQRSPKRPQPLSGGHRGPPRQLSGHLLEVMVELIPPRGMHIFHVTPARQKHLDRMESDSR